MGARIFTFVVAGLLLSLPVVAETQEPAATGQSAQQGMMQGGMKHDGMMQGGMMHGGMMGAKMKGMQMIPVTVTTIDAKTGLVDVSAGGTALKLQFPPASLGGVRVGDKLTVHLGFSKP